MRQQQLYDGPLLDPFGGSISLDANGKATSTSFERRMDLRMSLAIETEALTKHYALGFFKRRTVRALDRLVEGRAWPGDGAAGSERRR